MIGYPVALRWLKNKQVLEIIFPVSTGKDMFPLADSLYQVSSFLSGPFSMIISFHKLINLFVK